jgi:hypothetical protein
VKYKARASTMHDLKHAPLGLAVGAAVGARPEIVHGPVGVALGGQLWDAAFAGDNRAVGRLLAAGADPNASICMEKGPKGTPVDYTDKDRERGRRTPLYEAAVRGNLMSAQLLLDGGADPDLPASNGTTPLMAAAASGDPRILHLLLARGAVLDKLHPASGATAFHLACFRNEHECAAALARAGCDVTLENLEGQTGRQVRVGFGRIVASDIETPNTLANLV